MKHLASIFFLALALSASAQVLPYRSGTWNPDSLGNHRVVVEVKKEAKAVVAEIPWRRRDLNPEQKEILIFAAKDTMHPVFNRILIDVTRESGTVIFEPTEGAGTYYLYYLPFHHTGTYYPTVRYMTPKDEANPEWKRDVMQLRNSLPKARVVAMESLTPFHSFWPMEVIATGDELIDLVGNEPFMLFPELRDHPVRMFDAIPYRWAERGPVSVLADTAQPNEYFVFQVALYAASVSIRDVEIGFSDLIAADGTSALPASRFTCFNKTGNDWDQQPMLKTIKVEKGRVQPLWIGLDLPKQIAPGRYRATVSVRPEGQVAREMTLDLTVAGEVLADRGDSEPWKHGRLRWLNSTIAIDDQIIAPYTPVQVEGNVLSILGREIELGQNGLPVQIRSYFTEAMTRMGSEAIEVLAGEMKLVVEGDGETGRLGDWETGRLRVTKSEEGVVEWESGMKGTGYRVQVKGRLEFDGFMTYDLTLIADKATEVEDIRFEIPLSGDVAKYMLGLGRKGGLAPTSFVYRWDPYFNADGPWIGTVNAGIQASFRAENYQRPLNTNFYQQKPLNMPPSWYNGGKGAIKLNRDGGAYLINATSGPRSLTPGDTLHFNMHLLITPFRPIDTEKQWGDRYYHSFKPLDTIAAVGANVINVHHATDINPYINYPFITTGAMKDYIDAAHDRNYKVKIYYTVRELSNKCPELWALKSLGNEILSYGPGGGYSWLQEHLDHNYIAAWFVPELKDAAVINSGVSRWHNYYLEGLNWLVNNVGIDGLYIDDVAFDRSVMLRARKIMQRTNPGTRIDLHSANQFNHRDGFSNSANLYMEHFPYIDRLWFGEYFDYNAGPDYWMTEVAGIPFGLMGEMLQDGGNRWRGLLFGMTARAPWSGDPTPIWKLWDDFGIQGSEMTGFWVSDHPVKTGRPDVLATVYKKDNQVLIAIASWAAGPARIRLDIDWQQLVIDPANLKVSVPAIEGFQEAGEMDLQETFQVPEGKGVVIIVR